MPKMRWTMEDQFRVILTALKVAGPLKGVDWEQVHRMSGLDSSVTVSAMRQQVGTLLREYKPAVDENGQPVVPTPKTPKTPKTPRAKGTKRKKAEQEEEENEKEDPESPSIRKKKVKFSAIDKKVTDPDETEEEVHVKGEHYDSEVKVSVNA